MPGGRRGPAPARRRPPPSRPARARRRGEAGSALAPPAPAPAARRRGRPAEGRDAQRLARLTDLLEDLRGKLGARAFGQEDGGHEECRARAQASDVVRVDDPTTLAATVA